MRKNLIFISCGLLVLIILISFASRTGQEVEAQSDNNAEQSKSENKSAANKAISDSKNNSPDTTPILKPSDIIDEIRQKKAANPTIPTKELADYANEILKSKGYDFTFTWEPKGKENEENLGKLSFHTYLSFEYTFTKVTGSKQKFDLLNNNFDHPCFSPVDVPVTQINKKTLTVISDGKEIKLKKPNDFGAEEFVLITNAKQPIRKWVTPIDALPVGISEDGKKVYFDSWEFSQDETKGYEESPINLAVEISEDGSLRFVDLKELKSDKGVEVDYGNKYTEIQYIKYKVGKNEFIVKYSAPCT